MNTPILKPRNWVAKNNRCKSVRHRDRTAYQRQHKHRHRTPNAEIS